MTSSTAPDHTSTAGVFLVRDPAVVAALDALLRPHYTGPVTTPPQGGPPAAAVLRDATLHACGLLGHLDSPFPDDATVEDVLDHVHDAALDIGRRAATAEGREWSEAMQERIRRAEAAVAHSERDVESTRADLEKALAKIADLESRPPGRRPTVSALRLRDQKAWAGLADRMDREAMSQPKTPAAVLRMASKSVRDEIAAVYGGIERKAS